MFVFSINNGSAWVQVGADIVGKTAGDYFGDSVSLYLLTDRE